MLSLSLSKKRGKMHSDKNRKGFALVTAILAMMILIALGYLAISVSTGDLKISTRLVGEKKALSAAETGIHSLMQDYSPENGKYTVQVDGVTASGSQYSISRVGRPASGPATLPLKGYSIGGGQSWRQKRYAASVTGMNTTYDSSVQIDVGMGYGPVEETTMSR